MEEKKKILSKLETLKLEKNSMERKQLLIMAQSAQHDAAAIIGSNIDASDYGSVHELADDVCKLRDFLLEDLVEKYY